jgi:hypothetical protein
MVETGPISAVIVLELDISASLLNNPATGAERSVAKPAKPPRGCTCNCRADADDSMPDNLKPGLPLFAFAAATAADCVIARKQACRDAIEKLRMKPKHVKSRCTD